MEANPLANGTHCTKECFWAAGGYRKHAMASSCMNAKWSQQHHGVQVGFPHGRLQLCSPMKRRRLPNVRVANEAFL
jgi:hypothetical protein